MDLVESFIHFLATGQMAPGAFTDNVFLDMNVPTWRIQFQGRVAVQESRASLGQWRVHPGPVTETTNGFVVETAVDESAGLTSRSVNVVTVADGQIAKIVHYCTGTWDPATRDRHSREVELLIP